MTFIDELQYLADEFDHRFQKVKHVVEIPTRDYGWVNHRYTSPLFRLAHVEKFVQDRFAVVHVCVFPHPNDPAPIYGFDVIAGEQKATGLFFDLSPTVRPTEPFTELKIERPRERPEWGDIFSENWIACRPTLEEFKIIAKEAVLVLDNYLLTLSKESAKVELVVQGQNRYCKQQKQNVHTRAALNRIIGNEATDEFMNTILFPEIPEII